MPPLFSVIIPVYNSERSLIECVQSVLKQDFKDLEIILIGDCSTDKSSEICASFAEQNEAIKVIRHKKNSGVSASRNTGIHAACGTYIIFLDSDDCLFDGCLNGIAKLIEENDGPEVIIGKYIHGYENTVFPDCIFDNTVINTGDPDDVITYINSLDRFICTCWRFVVNRNFLIKNDIYFSNVKIYEEQNYVARLLCFSKKFAFYNGCFYWNRMRIASLSHSIDYDSAASCLEIANEICSFIKNNDLSDPKKSFCFSSIEYVLKRFQIYLCANNRKEIYALSKIIEKNMDNYKILKNNSYGSDRYFFNKVRGIYNSLLLTKRLITKETISLVKNVKYKELYIFCVSLFGKITAQILQNEGYCLKGFLDNNKASQGSIVLDLKVSNPSVLSYKSKDKLSDIFVIVCTERGDVFREISSQLEEIGLREDQIAHKIFNSERSSGSPNQDLRI